MGTLPGFRQFFPQECALRDNIFDTWRRTAKAFAFQPYEAPTLEPLELYIEKSGQEVVDQLFCFQDKGGRAIALRPELTPSLAAMVGAKAAALKRPIKWFNVGECYRYERPQKGRLRAFYQFNADILGEAGPGADAELIALMITTFQNFGLTEQQVHIRLSDRTLWLQALSSWGVPQEQLFAVLNIIDKREREAAQQVIAKLEALHLEGEKLLQAIDHLSSLRSLQAIEAFLNTNKHHEPLISRLEDWKVLMAQLEAMELLPFITIDLGIVRGLAYYTGFVYEAFERSGQGRALAGGGRYDTLVEKLGGPQLPAAGFAMGDVTLQDCLQAHNCLPAQAPQAAVFIAITEESLRPQALRLTQQLRRHGLQVQGTLKPTSLNKQLEQAQHVGAHHALTVSPEGLVAKDLRNGHSEVVKEDVVVEWLRAKGHSCPLGSPFDSDLLKC